MTHTAWVSVHTFREVGSDLENLWREMTYVSNLEAGERQGQGTVRHVGTNFGGSMLATVWRVTGAGIRERDLRGI